MFVRDTYKYKASPGQLRNRHRSQSCSLRSPISSAACTEIGFRIAAFKVGGKSIGSAFCTPICLFASAQRWSNEVST